MTDDPIQRHRLDINPTENEVVTRGRRSKGKRPRVELNSGSEEVEEDEEFGRHSSKRTKRTTRNSNEGTKKTQERQFLEIGTLI